VQRAVTGVEPRPAADHGVFLAQQVGRFRRVWQQGGGDVAAADVFGQGALDVGGDGGGRWYGNGGGSRAAGHVAGRNPGWGGVRTRADGAHAPGKPPICAVAIASSASNTGMPSSTR